MRILLDTNIVLDILLQRAPFSVTSHQVLESITGNAGTAFITPHSLATCYYLCAKTLSEKQALNLMRDVLAVCEVCSFGHDHALKALEISDGDFEDAMIIAAATDHHFEAIITRNIDDFQNSSIKALTPEAFLDNQN